MTVLLDLVTNNVVLPRRAAKVDILILFFDNSRFSAIENEELILTGSLNIPQMFVEVIELDKFLPPV